MPRRAFSSLLAGYRKDLRARHYSLATQNQARYVLPRLFAHLRADGIVDVRAASAAHLVSFARRLQQHRTRQGRPLALWSQRAYLVAVRAFFAYLCRRGLALDDPSRDLALPKLHTIPRPGPSEKEAARIVNAPVGDEPLARRDRALLELLYGTGIRLSECVRINLQDLDLAQGLLLIRNGKGRRDRMVPVPARAALSLDLYVCHGRSALASDLREDALFLSKQGHRLQPITVQVTVRKYGVQARLPTALSPHRLRHACATHLLRGGASVRHVQELLGHRNLETTALYTRVEPSDLRRVMRASHPRQ